MRTMNFDEVQFDRRPTYRRLVIGGVTLVAFTLGWRFVPHDVLYWILLPLLIVLLWLASHGWRQALVALRRATFYLEQLDNGGLR